MKHLFISILTLLALCSPVSVHAEEISEGFEDVTLTNADTWGRATILSNGWIIQGGYIALDASSYNYGFWATAHDGSRSLTAQSGSTNNAYVIIPVLLSGDVTFYYRKTGTDSRSVGKVYAYKVTESEGTYTIGSQLFRDEEATTSWQQCTSIRLTEPTMIAFKMVRAAIDDVTYTTATFEPHEHSYATEWSYDANEHWHACTSEVGICDANKTDVAAHDGALCSVCGYEVAGVKTFPWTETFNDITSGVPTDWDNNEGTVTTASYKWSSYFSGHDGKCVRFDSYYNNDGRTNVLATPYLFIPKEGEYELNFWYKNPKGGDFSVKVAEYGSNERAVLAQNLTDISEWTENTLSLADYAGKIVKLYFCGTSNYNSGDAYIYLDDVTVVERIIHKHDYATTWSTDETNHWHACTSEVEECDAPKADQAAHIYGEVATETAYYTCSVCLYENATRKTEYEAAAEKAAADQAAATAVVEKFNAIGTVEYTEASKTLIDEAREAYEALTEEQAALITENQLKVLTDAEAAYAELKAAAEKAAADQAAADAVVEQFNAIGTVEYTDDSMVLIYVARKAYASLTDEQKSLITEEQLKVLTDAEEAYVELKADAEDAKYAILTYAVADQSDLRAKVKKGEVSLDITAEEGWTIASLTINEEDKLADLSEEGTLTFDMQEDATVSVAYKWADEENLYSETDITTSVITTKAGVKAYVNDGQIFVESDGAAVSLYTINGAKVAQKTPSMKTSIFNVPAGIYIVKVGNEGIKLLVE